MFLYILFRECRVFSIRKKLFLISLFFLLSATPTSEAQFNFYETDNVRLVYYGELQAYLAAHAVRCFENSYRFHSKHWDYKSKKKMTVLLYDLTDFGNAGATSIPWNSISVAIAPNSYTYETLPANERINWVMNHEMVHVVALDKPSRRDRFFRSIFFGKVSVTADHPVTMLYGYFTSPRRSAPIWFHEGIAVFHETWMAGGLGRALGSYDEMVFRTKVRDGNRFYYPVGLEAEGTKIDFQIGVNSYLYGTRFLSYLAYRHGPESLVNWVNRVEGSKAYFLSQFKKVYGVSLHRMWSEWIDWERRFQKENLELIRKYPITSYINISSGALGSISRAYYDKSDEKLYAAINFPGQIAHISEIDIKSGDIKKICYIKSAALYFVTSLAYDPDSKTLFYTEDHHSWRDIKSINLNTGRSKMLLKDARIGDLVFNATDQSLWGIRHFNGISTLVRIPYPYEEWNQIYSWPYGKDIYDLDISPDGKSISCALAEISGRQSLIMMKTEKLTAGDSTYNVLFDFGNSNPSNFIFSDDGRYLFGSSYYSGVSNIYRFNIEADTMEAVTNSETGFFRPLPVSDDSLIDMNYTGKGFMPVKIANNTIEDINAIKFLGQKIVKKYPLLKDWVIKSPVSINLDTLNSDSGKYYDFSYMKLSSLYPIVEGYKHYTSVGMRVNFTTPIGFHDASMTASYSPSRGLPSDERWHARFDYSYLGWDLSLKYNSADFYDLFGPTKTSRKGYSFGANYKKTLIYDDPRNLGYTIHATGYGGLKRLPDYQNVSASYDRFAAFGGQMNYQYLRASLGAVDYEKGFKSQLISNNYYVNNKLYPRLLSTIDIGFPLPLYHTSFWLRGSAGYSFGERTNSFAYFYFGGFGNNWIDSRAIKRYRQYYSFPGVELNSIAATDYAKIIAELSLPPLRFRQLGFPAFYGIWIRSALFASAITTDFESDNIRQTFYNIGIQVDFRMQLLSHNRLTFSIGFASAFENRQKISDEFMISLKVL